MMPDTDRTSWAVGSSQVGRERFRPRRASNGHLLIPPHREGYRKNFSNFSGQMHDCGVIRMARLTSPAREPEDARQESKGEEQ